MDNYLDEPLWMEKVHAFLKELGPCRHRIYTKFICLFSHQMNTMATKQIVQSGWAKVGIWPPNPRQFASRWALWDTLPLNEQDYFMDCCRLIAIQMINGTADGIDAETEGGCCTSK